ncbi:40S ribosomal protein S5-1 [Hordeum vulgare]|nr:40S ribosomal protein S5-1 [Hordeum vulgare]
MTSPKASKDKIFEKVINPYLTGVPQHPQSIQMREGMLHIRDVEGPKKTGSVEARLEAMEQQVFKCQEMVERGLNANHMMITEFTNKHTIDANDIGKHLSRLYDRIDHLQAQIYDLQNQNCTSNISKLATYRYKTTPVVLMAAVPEMLLETAFPLLLSDRLKKCQVRRTPIFLYHEHWVNADSKEYHVDVIVKANDSPTSWFFEGP